MKLSMSVFVGGPINEKKTLKCTQPTWGWPGQRHMDSKVS